METWKPIPEYEGLYEVSDMGRVRSLDRVVKHARYGPQALKGRILSLRTGGDGYLMVSLYKDGESKTTKVHKLVKNTFHGPNPEGLNVLHGKRGQKCNELSNLEFGTQKQNSGPDKVRDGTLARGEKNGRAKLTEVDVKMIKHQLKAGWNQEDIAKIFGVTRQTISNIKCAKSWAHLDL